jgi:hypothetical protein
MCGPRDLNNRQKNVPQVGERLRSPALGTLKGPVPASRINVEWALDKLVIGRSPASGTTGQSLEIASPAFQRGRNDMPNVSSRNALPAKCQS